MKKKNRVKVTIDDNHSLVVPIPKAFRYKGGRRAFADGIMAAVNQTIPIIEKMNKNDGFHMAVGTSRGRPTYEESIIGE